MTSFAGPGRPGATAAQPHGSGAQDNPTRLHRAAFLVNAPFSYGADGQPGLAAPDRNRAMVQFLELYRYLAAEALVYVLPTPDPAGTAGLPYTASLGAVLEHLPGRGTVVLARHRADCGRAAVRVGERFFGAMGYRTETPRWPFGGELDLRHLRDNVYLGGYGRRTPRRSFEWMERTFGMRVIPLRQRDPRLPLSRTVLPLTTEQALVCTELHDAADLARLERHTGVVDVPLAACRAGICGSVRLNNVVLNASPLHELRRGCPEYADELAKNRLLEDVAAVSALEVAFFNLSEFHRSGAVLSDLVLHLNRFSYRFRLL